MIVYVDGVFDLTHDGHFKLFENAKSLGDTLYVGVLSDAECTTYKRKPVLTSNERKKNISHSPFVNKIITDVPNVITKEFINKYKIDIVAHAHTREEDDTYHYQYKVPKQLGIFKRLDYTNSISTTEIIKRILNNYK